MIQKAFIIRLALTAAILCLTSCKLNSTSTPQTADATCVAGRQCSSPALMILGVQTDKMKVSFGTGSIVTDDRGTMRILTAGHVVNNPEADLFLALPTRDPKWDHLPKQEFLTKVKASIRSGELDDFRIPQIKLFPGIETPLVDAHKDLAFLNIPKGFDRAINEGKILPLAVNFKLNAEDLANRILTRPNDESFSIVSAGINDDGCNKGYMCVVELSKERINQHLANQPPPSRSSVIKTPDSQTSAIRTERYALEFSEDILKDHFSDQYPRLMPGDSGSPMILIERDADYIIGVYHADSLSSPKLNTFTLIGDRPGIETIEDLEAQMERRIFPVCQ